MLRRAAWLLAYGHGVGHSPLYTHFNPVPARQLPAYVVGALPFDGLSVNGAKVVRFGELRAWDMSHASNGFKHVHLSVMDMLSVSKLWLPGD